MLKQGGGIAGAIIDTAPSWALSHLSVPATGGGPPPAPAYVQTTGQGTTTASFANVTAGNTLIVSSFGNALAAPPTDPGGAYSPAGSVTYSNGYVTRCDYRRITSSGPVTISSPGATYLTGYEFAHVTGLDNVAAAANTTASMDSGPLTTVHAVELLVGLFGSVGGAITITSPTTPLVAANVLADAYQVTSATGTFHATATTPSGGTNAALLAGFY